MALQKLVRDMSVGTLVMNQPLGTSASLQKLVRDMSVGTHRTVCQGWPRITLQKLVRDMSVGTGPVQNLFNPFGPAKAGKGYECWDQQFGLFPSVHTPLQKLVRDMSVGTTLAGKKLDWDTSLQKLVRDMSVGTIPPDLDLGSGDGPAKAG